MQIIEYCEQFRDEWDEFVLKSNNGTMFHLQRFLDYHRPGKFKFHHLIFLNEQKIVAVLPGQLRDGVFESPVGASFGSIVTPDLKFSAAMQLVSNLLDYGRQQGFKEFMLTSAPMIYEKFPNQNLDFAMLWQGFHYETHYISSAIKLDPATDIIGRFQASVRNYVRKTLRNPDLHAELSEDYEAFYPILLRNLSKHNVKPTHSFEDLLRLRELLPSNLKLFMVLYKNKPIAGSLVFLCNDRVALCFYNMMLYEYAEHKPIHRAMYEVVKFATENGYRYVDIGVSQDTSASNPMTPNTNLIAFKETFDAKTIMRNTLRIKL